MAIAVGSESVADLEVRAQHREAERERLVAEIASLGSELHELTEAIIAADAEARDSAKAQAKLAKTKADIALRRDRVEQLDAVIVRIGELKQQAIDRERKKVIAKLEDVLDHEQQRIAQALFDLSQGVGAEARILNDLQMAGAQEQPILPWDVVNSFFGWLGSQSTDHPALTRAGFRARALQEFGGGIVERI